MADYFERNTMILLEERVASRSTRGIYSDIFVKKHREGRPSGMVASLGICGLPAQTK